MLFSKKMKLFFGLTVLLASMMFAPAYASKSSEEGSQKICWLWNLIPTNQAYASETSEEGFKSLFNGKNLEGWIIQGLEKAGPKVEDGVLKVGGWDYWAVITKDEFGDFILRFDVKFDARGNSGILIHTDKKEVYKNAFEIQFAAEDGGKPSGTIFIKKGSIKDPEKSPMKATGEWNNVEIKYVTPKLWLTINGETVYDGLDVSQLEEVEVKEKGHIAIQRNDYKKAAYYKNIRVKELE